MSEGSLRDWMSSQFASPPTPSVGVGGSTFLVDSSTDGWYRQLPPVVEHNPNRTVKNVTAGPLGSEIRRRRHRKFALNPKEHVLALMSETPGATRYAAGTGQHLADYVTRSAARPLLPGATDQPPNSQRRWGVRCQPHVDDFSPLSSSTTNCSWKRTSSRRHGSNRA